MRRLRRAGRVAWRISLLAAGTSVLYLLQLGLLLLLRPFPERLRRARDFVLRKWSRLIQRVLRIEVDVRGRPPRAPCLLVSNHLSYLDIPILFGSLGARFVAKSEVRSWPGIGLLCRAAGTIFVDRSRRQDVVKVSQHVADALARGDAVALFPEGTSTDGLRVAPFHASLLQHAAEARLPVHYATLSYRTPPGETPAEVSVCWWGDMTFGDHLLDLLALPRFEARIVFGPDPLAADDRKLLARRLHAAVASGLAVSGAHVPPPPGKLG